MNEQQKSLNYAPEDLEGDVTPLLNFIGAEMEQINNDISEGNAVDPINVPDVTKEEWLEYIEGRKVFYKEHHEDWQKYYDEKKQEGKDSSFHPESIETKIVLDEEIVAAAKGFMTGPVGLFRNKMVAAETQRFDNIHEMKIFIINMQCKTKDMVLYETYERNGVYYWRGAFVDKQ